MKWDQQALEAWLEESAQKDEDALTLKKYSKEDDSKIKVISHFKKNATQLMCNKFFVICKPILGFNIENREISSASKLFEEKCRRRNA